MGYFIYEMNKNPLLKQFQFWLNNNIRDESVRWKQ